MQGDDRSEQGTKVIGGAVRWLSAAGTFRRALEIGVLISTVAFLGIIVYIVWRVSESNARSDIAQVIAPIVVFALLAIVLATAAAIVDRNERKHELAVAKAAATPATGTAVVATKPWRGTALAGLAVLAFSLALISSTQLGRLRTTTEFTLRDKHNVAQCDAWDCGKTEQAHLESICAYDVHKDKSDAQEAPLTAEDRKADPDYAKWVDSGRKGIPPQRSTYGHDCYVYVHSCNAKILAPAAATTNDEVAIDLSVACPNAPPQRMPVVDAHYYAEPWPPTPPNRLSEELAPKGPAVHNSFASAKTLTQNERTWRWFVRLPSGQQPLDIKLTFLGDTMVIPYKRINVAEPTTIASLQEYTAAIGGLLGALLGLLGTVGSVLKGIRGHSSTVVPAQAATPDAEPSETN